MTDADSNADDELEAVRERKLEELKEAAAATDETGVGGDTATGAPDEPVHVDGPEHYESLIARYPVVLVDFYADWCGPCKMLEPVVDDLAAETDAAVLKVDIDAHQGLAQDQQVRGVPTLLVYADGEPVDRVVGVSEKHELAAKIEAAT